MCRGSSLNHAGRGRYPFIGVDLTPGLPTTVLVVSFFSGVQLLALGVVGEYIGRIYDEAKRRPMYIVDRKVNFNE